MQKKTEMTKFKKRGLGLLLALTMLFGLSMPTSANVSASILTSTVTDTAAHIYATVKEPQVGSIGGEWAVLGLARSGCEVPEAYYQNYYSAVVAHVKACNGILHEKKYTEYSRVILALTAVGADPANVAGYDLLIPLGDFDKTIWQGINGPVWALIALDSGNYAMPVNAAAETQATRQMYVDEILARQTSDGGWALSSRNDTADADITGMVLQALAKYQDQAAVKEATERALICLSGMQDADGGYASRGASNSESVVQVIVALCELGISLDDARFVKNGNTLLDNLMYYRQTDGSFSHTSGGNGSSQMATEQGFYGLVAAQRAAQGKTSLYRMSDVLSVAGSASRQAGEGLTGKHADISAQSIVSPGKTFADISDYAERSAIEVLASRGIINGYNDTAFGPEDTMTRAQFAAIVVRALGLPLAATGNFTDVPAGAWCAAYVDTAYTYGIVNGRTSMIFDPNGTITRQEAAVMVARAAKLCGMDTDMEAAAVRDVLAQFGDYVTTGSWAREGMAFCYQSGILDQSDMDIRPYAAIKRCEVAQMVYGLLRDAELL